MALGKLAEAEEALVGPMLPMGVSSDAPIPGGAAGLYLLARICRSVAPFELAVQQAGSGQLLFLFQGL